MRRRPVTTGSGLWLHVNTPCDNLNNCPGLQEGIRKYCARLDLLPPAGVAQSVEHLICNQRVGGSIPFASSRKTEFRKQKRFASTRASGAVFKALLQFIFPRVQLSGGRSRPSFPGLRNALH